MRIVKMLGVGIVIFMLMMPLNALASECAHEFGLAYPEKPTITSSEDYCSIVTNRTVQPCRKCSYKIVTERTEYNPHVYELVCINANTQAYQGQCTGCGRIQGPVIYPYSVGIPDVSY